MKNNKILVIFTGGTIGSIKSNRIIAPNMQTGYELIERYYKSHSQNELSFMARQPLCVLSENIVPDNWLMIAKSLEDAKEFLGVIIAHGTDTLPYTAAALSYLFSNIAVPVVLTGSNYPLADPRSEGMRNFSAAVDFIQTLQLPGIYVSFENNQGNSIIHLGSRLMQATTFTDVFSSLGDAYFGCMKNGRFYWHDHPYNPPHDSIHPAEPQISINDAAFSNEILYICPQPGLVYDYFLSGSKKPLAILHGLYHSGTACTNPDKISFSILNFIKKANRKDISVYIAPIRHTFGDLYISAQELRAAGAFPLENITLEAAWVKLMLAYGSLNKKQDIDRYMNTTLSHEILNYHLSQ